MVRTGLVLAVGLACAASFGSAFAFEHGSHSNAPMKHMSPAGSLLRTVQEVCCPAGYPWLRDSTNTCYSSEADCRDTNGGGWSCRQVNAC